MLGSPRKRARPLRLLLLCPSFSDTGSRSELRFGLWLFVLHIENQAGVVSVGLMNSSFPASRPTMRSRLPHVSLLPVLF